MSGKTVNNLLAVLDHVLILQEADLGLALQVLKELPLPPHDH